MGLEFNVISYGIVFLWFLWMLLFFKWIYIWNLVLIRSSEKENFYKKVFEFGGKKYKKWCKDLEVLILYVFI